MKTITLLLPIILLSKIASSQDTVINLKSFKTIPESGFNKEKVLFKLIQQKGYDYWEYRLAYDTQIDTDPFDSINCIPPVVYKYKVLENGHYKDKTDSIKLSIVNCTKGFWWIPPNGAELYFASIKSNKIDSVVTKADLFEFLKPFNSLDKIFLFYANYIPLMYKQNQHNFEIIAFDNQKPIRYFENKHGHFNVFEKFYLRINNNGKLYKKRMGEYHLKATGHYVIP